ncbi:MAG: iron-containing alcohol dehydrogenase [Proteocatella sp.]
MTRFTIPRDVFMGDDAISHLKNIKGKKAYIVIGSERLKKDGTLGKVEGYLKEAGIESKVFIGVENDPSVQTVKKGTAEMLEYNPDWIIGIGGGSPIDAAKAMWLFYEYPEFTFEEAVKPFNLPELRKKARFIGITTTSGTATEVTSFSVITDNETGIKYPIADFNLTPDIAIVDTNLVLTLTPKVVANTGLDVLTHAIEAYVSTMATPLTDALAMKAIEMTVENLEASYKEDMTARKNMHIAQNLAGMAFSNAILGIVHSMAHKTGDIFKIPHGLANAIYLSYAIEYNAKTAPEKYAEIAKQLRLEGSADNELVQSLLTLIKRMRKDLGVPSSLQEFGIDEADFLKRLPSIAKTAVADPCTGTNPRAIDDATMENLYRAAYYGEKVNF